MKRKKKQSSKKIGVAKKRVRTTDKKEASLPAVQITAQTTEQKAEAIAKPDPKNSVTALEVAIVLSNLRIPHHDEKAIQLCLMHVKDLNVDKIILNGDILDFHRRSDINRNPLRMLNDKEMMAMRREIVDRIRKEEDKAEAELDKVNKEKDDNKKVYKRLSTDQVERIVKHETLEQALKKELEQFFGIVKKFKEVRPSAEFIWIYGCQEHYLVTYLAKYFPNLLKTIDDFCKSEKVLQVNNGTRNNVYNYGQLVIGHWLRGGLSSPSAFVAHTLLDDEGVSLIQGHTNRGGWACRTIEGLKYISAYENFSLCKRPVGKNWQLGYSLVYREKDKKRFQVFQVPIASYGFFWGTKEYRLDEKVGFWETAVTISDIHIPYEDEQALAAACSFLKELQPNVVFVNGDVNDFQDISRFAGSPLDFISDKDAANFKNLIVEGQNGSSKFLKPRLQREFEKIFAFFKLLRELCPNARIVWIFGNHEYRLQRYVEENASALAGVRKPGGKEEILSLMDITRVRELGVEVVYSGLIESYTTYGGLLVGHFYRVNAKSAYTARNLLQKKHQSLVQPHVHRVGAHYKTRLDGKVLVAVEQGCLCQLNPHYMQNPNWQHGFVVIHKKKNSDRFYLQPIHIVDGAFLFGGKRFGRPSHNNTVSDEVSNNGSSKTDSQV